MYREHVYIVHIEVDCQQHLKVFSSWFHLSRAVLLTPLILPLTLHKFHHLLLRPIQPTKERPLKRNPHQSKKKSQNNLTSSSANNPTYRNSVISLSSKSPTFNSS